jgi:hypothetical protein
VLQAIKLHMKKGLRACIEGCMIIYNNRLTILHSDMLFYHSPLQNDIKDDKII